MKFTEEQKKILEHDPEKHACILAGPETGKSSTVIGYISKVRKEYPEKTVRLLTFTRAANRELMDKIINAGQDTVISSTIHSFAISILLKKNPGASRLPEPIRIADDWEWNILIKKDLSKRLEVRTSYIAKLKNEMSASWESLSPQEDPSVPPEIRARFMGLWEEHGRIFGYTLLSELPFRFKIALESNPDLDLGNLELIAVDEYQDLNPCDLKCFRILAERGITILAIGDDDQSIYQFRKAHPEGIRSFPNEYDAKQYPLTISHRCGKKILEWANFVIQGDTSRAKKPSLSPSENNPEGVAKYLVFNRENSEAEGVCRLVKWLTEKEKIPYEEILVLVRTGNIAKLIKKHFKRAKIPFADPEDYLNILESPKTRYLLSILRILINKKDSLAWWAILELTKGIGQKTVNFFYDLARANNKQFGEIILQEMENGFENLSRDKRLVQSTAEKVFDIVNQVEISESENQWGRWVNEQIRNGKLPTPEEGFSEILEKVDEEKSGNDMDLSQYINQIEPEIKDIMNAKVENRLRIMTLSRSKGLTVRAVIIVGVENGIIPHPKARDYQEERRLLYVGMTRAEEYLFLTRCRRRTGLTARSGRKNVAGRRHGCSFLDGGPVNETDGESELKILGV